jgi:phytoene dehydrogenase-like protein
VAQRSGVPCAAIICSTGEPLFDDAPILLTPGFQRVVGIFSPILLDPTVSQEGLYLYDVFFPVHGADRRAELRKALGDMGTLFPGFDETLVWHLPMFFTGSWPGTESNHTFGQTGDRRLVPTTPVRGLYLVGTDVQGSGTAGDLIPVGVRRLLEVLDCQFPAQGITAAA